MKKLLVMAVAVPLSVFAADLAAGKVDVSEKAGGVRADEVVCDGEYGGHLQGVATDGTSLYWSFTVEVVRTDRNGKVLATSGAVPRHQGDLCVKDGVVYVAVNLGGFNQLAAGKSEVWAYDAQTMKHLRTWPLDMPYGAGGMTVVGDRFFVIGGLPATVEENPVYEYDAEFRLVKRHALSTGFTLMGIQTAAFEDGRFLFGIYGGKGNPGGVLVCPRDLSSFVRRTGPGNVGIVTLDGTIWTGRTFRGRSPKSRRGKLVRSPGYPESEEVYGPSRTGKGELRIFFEGLSADGWTDCGYSLQPNGYKPLTSATNVFVRTGEAAGKRVFPAVGIGGTRSYSVPDLVRGVRRAAECDETLSVHLPGVPDDLPKDVRLHSAVMAMEAEAGRLGVRILNAEGNAGKALVPAPRSLVPSEGCLVIEPKVKYTLVDWYDFDRVGQAFAEMRKTVTTDASLPKEGYRLKVTKDGVSIAAADAAGEFYAMQTLRQLAVPDGTNSVSIPCCEVKDWPTYRWRGFLIDEARHFLGKEGILKILDTMAAHKLNVLHWHLTDDQGWRLELKRHPELVRYGATRPRSVRFGSHAMWRPPDHKHEYEFNNVSYGPHFHTQEDVKEILAYAKARHITVVPEVELPGHVRALLAAHPELICEGRTHGREPGCAWSVQKEVLCVGNEAVLPLYREIFDEVCELFPESPFIHIGGDECPRANWKTCPKCQALMAREGMKDESGLQAWITSKIVRYLESKGRRAVGWDEILAGDVPKSAVGMVWRTNAKGGAGTTYVSAAEAVRRGHDVVMASSRYCYLEKPQGLAHDPLPYFSVWHKKDELTLRVAYDYDPLRDIPPDCRGHVIGGQICMWGESMFNIFDLEWKAWPRGCAIAEILWLGDAKPGFDDFRRRMEAHRIRLLDNHVNCAPLE